MNFEKIQWKTLLHSRDRMLWIWLKNTGMMTAGDFKNRRQSEAMSTDLWNGDQISSIFPPVSETVIQPACRDGVMRNVMTHDDRGGSSRRQRDLYVQTI